MKKTPLKKVGKIERFALWLWDSASSYKIPSQVRDLINRFATWVTNRRGDA